MFLERQGVLRGISTVTAFGGGQTFKRHIFHLEKIRSDQLFEMSWIVSMANCLHSRGRAIN